MSMHQFDYLFGEGLPVWSTHRDTPRDPNPDKSNEKPELYYIGMSVMFLSLPFALYGLIHLFI